MALIGRWVAVFAEKAQGVKKHRPNHLAIAGKLFYWSKPAAMAMKQKAFPMQCLRSLLPVSACLLLPGPPVASGAVMLQSFDRPLGIGIEHSDGNRSEYTINGKVYKFQWKLAPSAVDLDGNGTGDLTIVHKVEPTDGSHHMFASITGRNQIWASARGLTGRYFGSFPIPFLANAEIGPSLFSSNPRTGWHNDDELVDPSSLGGLHPFSTRPFDQAYIGLRFERDNALHYAWMAISKWDEMRGREIYIHAWAWESEPGKGILAGAIPEPGAGWLSLAGGWLYLQRRRRG